MARHVSAVLGMLFLAHAAAAQFTQQGNKLVGTGAVGAANQGSVAISADGNTAIVGGWADNSQVGAAWVFARTGGAWTQQGNKLVGTGAVGNAGQGASVAISADGTTAIVGAPGDNSYAGAALVYTRAGGVWSQQGSKLVGAGSAELGTAVAISADGNTAIVGGSHDQSGLGAAWVFTRSGGAWSQQGGKLVGTGAVGDAGQGYSVAISADGNTAIVGGVADNSLVGANAVVNPNVKVYPFKTVESGAVVTSSIVWESRGARTVFGRRGIRGLANVDITPDPEVHVHRVGRTGRAGASGLAVTLGAKPCTALAPPEMPA